jgi:hypothetical protein
MIESGCKERSGLFRIFDRRKSIQKSSIFSSKTGYARSLMNSILGNF